MTQSRITKLRGTPSSHRITGISTPPRFLAPERAYSLYKQASCHDQPRPENGRPGARISGVRRQRARRGERPARLGAAARFAARAGGDHELHESGAAPAAADARAGLRTDAGWPALQRLL